MVVHSRSDHETLEGGLGVAHALDHGNTLTLAQVEVEQYRVDGRLLEHLEDLMATGAVVENSEVRFTCEHIRPTPSRNMV